MVRQKRKYTVLTSQKVSQIQQLYFHGDDIPSISIKISIKQDTIEKAIRSGRIILYRPANQAAASTKSERTVFDSEQLLGKACSNVVGRILSCKSATPCKVDFSNQLADGDRVDIYPGRETIDGNAIIRLQPVIFGEIRFVLDGHLGKLASYLRLLGFDTLYRNIYDDDELAEISQ